MARLLKYMFPASLALLVSITLGQQTPVTSRAPETAASVCLDGITPAVQEFIDRGEIAGAITLVARNGRIVHFEAQGLMDIASARPLQRDTIMRIYSMTKPITSVAVMMLCEEGRCRLEDPVAKYIPELKGLGVFVKNTASGPEIVPPDREMTIHDLLRHTSGLIYGFGNGPVDHMYQTAQVLDMDSTLHDMMLKLAKLPLAHQPGERWTYGVSVDVLGRVIEKVSGKPLDRFFEERIFRPLNMTDTGFFVPPEKLARFATNYGPDADSGLKVIDTASTSRYARPATLLSGGGGLVSTASDYLRFCQMLLNKGQLDGTRLLRPETVERMTRDHLPAVAFPIRFDAKPEEGVGFGLGLAVRVKEAASSAAPVGEYGWGGAASTHFWISPADQLIVIALSQYMPFSPRLREALKPLIYEGLSTQVP